MLDTARSLLIKELALAKKTLEAKVEEEVRQILNEMEEGNGNIAKLGRSLAEECVESQYQTAFKYGIYHNSLVFESDIMREVFSKGLEYLKNNKAVVLEKEGKNKGCLVVKIDNEEEFGKMENPDKVLIRSDGTAVYTGKDVIFHLWKFGIVKNDFSYSDFIKQPNGKVAKKTDKKGKKEKFANATKVINVIGVEQSYPQKVIVEVLKKLKNEKEANSLKHLAYEQVWLPEGKFSGRAGTWVGYTADELAHEAKSRALEKIKSEFEEGEREEIARIVGVGAIRFAFLKISAEKKITFKWEDALNMEGDSGPYVQYAYVRTNGILSKTKISAESKEIQFNESERDLIKSLAKLREVSQKSAKEMTTHNIAQYSIEVATKFSSFYANTQVINEQDLQKTKARLALVSATGIVLKNKSFPNSLQP
jgi:arginyl-tRNA synthetase